MYKTDIEIAQDTPMNRIVDVAKTLNVSDNDLELYGNYKAKLKIEKLKGNKNGKLILVTAISPTTAGEGKTTITVGLGDALQKTGNSVIITLREPSLGPVFGIKGGAAGGGYAQVVPMEDLNLHFTGDFHAIGAANNLLAALLDNHIQQGNELKIDVRRILWRRCVDMNDRQLRSIISGLGGKPNGMPREDGFDITAASEIMAVLCLSEDMTDLKNRLAQMTIAYDTNGNPVTAGQLKAQGAIAALLKDTIKPNLVQTLEHTPALIHGGPFANIAHGCNSVIATKTALKLSDYVVTEAGFGADLGAEKFLNIKCRLANLKPDTVVVVATVRALKHNGGAAKEDLNKADLQKLEKGLPNLLRHIDNITNRFGLPAVVAINRFHTDTDEEINVIREKCKQYGVMVTLAEVWEKGGAGGEELANEVIRLCNTPNKFAYLYANELSLTKKIEAIATKIYGADGVDFLPPALNELKRLEIRGLGSLPVCIAKTQYSFSDDPRKLGAPQNFRVTVRNIKACTGAGFIVAYLGDIMTMPGLPKIPATENIDVDTDGKITGLF